MLQVKDCGGMLTTTRSWERGIKQLLLEPPIVANPADTLIADFKPSKL
jgi:hypothetical protein